MATYTEPRSATGSSTGMCAESPFAEGSEGPAGRTGRIPRRMSIKPFTGADALKTGTCMKCGLVGRHRASADCIEALRDRLARWE